MRKILKSKITKIAVASVAVIFITGCEGKFDESASSSTLQTGVATQVYPGDTLSSSDNAQIDVTHRVSDDTKWVTVKSGSATLLRGDYTLNQ